MLHEEGDVNFSVFTTYDLPVSGVEAILSLQPVKLGIIYGSDRGHTSATATVAQVVFLGCARLPP